MKITDKQRVDWMQKCVRQQTRHYLRIDWDDPMIQHVKYEAEPGERDYFDETISTHRTLRQAIDAAIRAEKAGRK